MIYAIGMRSRSRTDRCRRASGRAVSRPCSSPICPTLVSRASRRRPAAAIRRFGFGQDLGAAFAGVADELHTQYLLGFTPPKRDGKVHEVSVRVTPGGLKTRAKKNYVAPKA